MKKENDELINLFRSRLENAELSVRDDFWEKLERNLPVAADKRKHMIHRIGAAASVLLLLGCASAAFWYFSPKEEIADAFTKMAVTTGTTGTLGVDVVKDDFPALYTKPVLPDPSTINPRSLASSVCTVEEEESISFSFSMSFSLSSENKPEEYTNEQNSFTGGFNEIKREIVSEFPVTILPEKESKRSKWSAKLSVSLHPFTGKQEGDGFLMFSKHKNSLNVKNKRIKGEISRADFISAADYENYIHIAQANSGAGQKTTVKHKIPYTIGISVRREFSEKFSLETGLMYTNLNSELTAGTDSYYKQDQKLHYLGIPLKVNMDIYDSGNLNLYASAGAVIEKCVAGKVKTKYYRENKNTYSSKQSVIPDPIQFSLVAGLGLQYNLTDRIALYAEPGISCYFDDGSPVATIRKDKPFNMNLLCGIRMSY